MSAEAATDLPVWDLSDLYSAPDSPDVSGDITEVQSAVELFCTDYKGAIVGLKPAAFTQAIERYETIQESLGKLGSYAQLLRAGDLNNSSVAKFAQDIGEQLNATSSNLIFFALEINRVEDAALADLMAHDDCQKYRPWIENVRVFRPHELADDV